MNSLAKGLVADAVSGWDDLTWTHLNQSNYIHHVLSRTETKKPTRTTSFGGNGVSMKTSDYACITDGLFVNMTLDIGPKYTKTNYCSYREFSASSFMRNTRPHSPASLPGPIHLATLDQLTLLLILSDWVWKSKNRTTRLTDMDSSLANYSGHPGDVTTLTHVL
ncbi:uncharacterized protein BDR25DRAFT_361948 [Lindgomyces ingoldianus]|uniref:Uncharacterized protein n=1 Tax=Lindgomyces ingoldianus TaxID=673940 RepID=A0ACB6QAX1_9PLEO|nr:uncharacterized protein BDR25DRAFT_361948 [Lindgomyces ingoldianus]KAF2464025.1 hypothetical protein BDR25DRAFT_361948 [Lindgomyces ingoldianus]